MEQETKKSALVAAKLKTMTACGYVQKSSSPELKYKFASEAELIRALRPAMIEAGLTITPTACRILSSESYQTKYGSLMRLVRTKHTFKLAHESGEFEEIVCFGEAADAGDKTLAKCQTIAFKYALRQAFCIETGDDPDQHASVPAETNSALSHVVEGAPGARLKCIGKKLGDLDRETLKKMEAKPEVLSEADMVAVRNALVELF